MYNNRTQESEYFTHEDYGQLDSILNKGGTRTLVCFCIDVSGSMRFILDGQDYKIDHSRDGITQNSIEGAAHSVYPKSGYTLYNRLDSLNEILAKMLSKMYASPSLRDGVVVSMIVFAQDADIQHSFMDIGLIRDASSFANATISRRCEGTAAGKAIQLALEQIEYAVSRFSQADVELRRPTIIFLSDGEPTDTRSNEADTVYLYGKQTSNDAYNMAELVRKLLSQEKIDFFPVLIGKGNASAYNFMRSLSLDRTFKTMNTEQDYAGLFSILEERLAYQNQMLVADETVRHEDSVEVEHSFSNKDSIIDTNSTGTIEFSFDDMFSVFSSDNSSDTGSSSDDSFFSL